MACEFYNSKKQHINFRKLNENRTYGGQRKADIVLIKTYRGTYPKIKDFIHVILKKEKVIFLGEKCNALQLYQLHTSVLLENIPLANFIKATSGARVVHFP